MMYSVLANRFLKKFIIKDGHWLWKGAVNQTTGHGLVTINGKLVYLHRYMFCLKNGINYKDDTILICHIRECNIPNCWAQEHLYVGDRYTNMQDSVALKTHWEAKKTHCIKGHEFSPQNTYISKNNKRVCLTCRRAFDKYRNKFR